MDRSEQIFVAALILNAVLVVLYLLYGIFFHKKNDLGENKRIEYVIRSVCMLICPVVVLLFFVTARLIRLLFFRSEVDLEDVVFNKNRVRQLAKADEEREKNIVPIEEALAVSDHTKLRELMLNVLKGDIEQSLASIALALDSEDSETSHYAASVLSKALNDFRADVRKLERQMREDEEHQAEYAQMLIRYMDRILKQKVFTSIEQKNFVVTMTEAGELLYQAQKKQSAELVQADEEKLQEQNEAARAGWAEVQDYEKIVRRLIEVEDYENAQLWCDRMLEEFPYELATYQAQLRLAFTIEDRERFSGTLERLKRSGIPIDNETLEMIRLFQ
jgi:hypothetical protein